MEKINYFAGQTTSKEYSHSLVLSPLPVKTNLSKISHFENILEKKEQYIEIGGLSGIIFQTQILWYILFLGTVVLFIPLYFSLGGFSEIHESSIEFKLVDGNFIKYLDYGALAFNYLMLFTPILCALVIIIPVLYTTHKMIYTTLPFRFHRQRREVMLSRWNKAQRKTQILFVPWEKVSAMVGHNQAITPAGVVSSATLVISATETDSSHCFWSSINMNTIDEFHAISVWEMIRRYMEEGEHNVPSPSPITLDDLLIQHCKSKNISPEQVSWGTKIWWYLNGTMIGIWRTNYLLQRMKVHAKDFPEVVEWSKPLPESEWQKPSEELKFYNKMLAENEYAKGHTILSIGDIREKYGHLAPSTQQDPQADETC